MKQRIKEAIETTLVVENKKSIDLCVEKILNIINQQTESVNLDDIDKLFNSLIEWVDDEFNKNLFIESFNHIKSKTKIT